MSRSYVTWQKTTGDSYGECESNLIHPRKSSSAAERLKLKKLDAARVKLMESVGFEVCEITQEVPGRPIERTLQARKEDEQSFTNFQAHGHLKPTFLLWPDAQQHLLLRLLLCCSYRDRCTISHIDLWGGPS